MSRAVFLDRDGVVIRAIIRQNKPYSVRSIEKVEILPGVLKNLKRLKSAGYLLVVITNQPDVARGQLSERNVEKIHNYLIHQLPLDEIKVCCHDDIDHCVCRKPAPGLLFEAARKHKINLAMSYTIGDRWRDIGAGIAAGTKTILIDYAYEEPGCSPEKRVASLTEGVDWILSQE